MRWFLICVIVLLSGQAAADVKAPSGPQDEALWSKGVSPKNKEAAQKLLEQGNDLFVQNSHREALAKYQEAVAAWDHPAIRFNMVRALIALDRPVEALESLEKALAFGKGPLEDHVYSEALNYKRLLEGQIAILEISCKQAGVKISIDGAEFLSCPGSKSKRTTPGSHAIVGSKPGFLTRTLDVVALPGKKQIDVSLVSLDDATLTRTRWATWKPWAIAAGGVAVTGLGVFLQIQSRSSFSGFDARVGAQCDDANGCTDAELGADVDKRSRGYLETRIGVPMMVVGGAAVIGGIALVILNRPRTVMREQRPTLGPALLGKDAAGAVLSGRF